MHYTEKIVRYIDTFASITSIITTLDKTESTERSKFQFEEGREEKEDEAPLRIAIDQLPTEQITIVVTNNRSGNVRHPLHPQQTSPPRLFQYAKAVDRRSTPRGRLNLTWKQETVLGFVSRPGRSQGTVLEQSGVATRESCYADHRETNSLARDVDDDDGDDDLVDNRGERRPRNARERHD